MKSSNTKEMKNLYKYTICGILVLLFSNCKKEVQIGAPVTQLVTTNVFNDNTTATAAALSVYSQMITYPNDLHRMTGLSSDELTNFAGDQTSSDLYTNGLIALTDGSNIPFWTESYSYIYQENAILENLQSSTGVGVQVNRQLTGEALFMRAFFYFYLTNLYGDVPLVTSTNYHVNATLPRTPKSQVYQQMIIDLKKAKDLLNVNYVDATDTATSPDRVRPNKLAASALLARVYLYNGNYDSAEIQATEVIGSSLFNLPTDLTTVFLKNSPEAIWQIFPSATDFWTQDGENFILVAAPGPATSFSVTISSSLLNDFEANDQRKAAWINSFTSDSSTWYYPYKYKDNYMSTNLNEYTIVLRLAEQYLIRSEARAMQSNMDGAVDDLNAIRLRAGLTAIAKGSLGQQQLLAKIAHERRVELFTEADRWIDLKRTNTIDAVMGGVNGACVAKGGTSWDTNQKLYPILTDDILKNSNIIQNKGY
jgi:hypothetical protein